MISTQLRRSLASHSKGVNRLSLSHRQLHSSKRVCARKDTQDKDSLKPEPNEYSKSGSDDAAAAVEDSAFSRDKTSPEEQHDAAGEEAAPKGMSNPLNVSPANHDISQPRNPQEGGHEGSSAQSGHGPSDRERSSGGGGAPKSGGGKYGGGGGA